MSLGGLATAVGIAYGIGKPREATEVGAGVVIEIEARLLLASHAADLSLGGTNPKIGVQAKIVVHGICRAGIGRGRIGVRKSGVLDHALKGAVGKELPNAKKDKPQGGCPHHPDRDVPARELTVGIIGVARVIGKDADEENGKPKRVRGYLKDLAAKDVSSQILVFLRDFPFHTHTSVPYAVSIFSFLIIHDFFPFVKWKKKTYRKRRCFSRQKTKKMTYIMSYTTKIGLISDIFKYHVS